jgi:predicted Zn finger-like uncharacterized protein
VYTRCSDCGTVFRLTATVLQMADGQVCCGNCGTTFDALAALYDEPPTETHADVTAAEPAPRDPEPALDETLEFDVPEHEWGQFFVDTAVTALPEDRVTPNLGESFEESSEQVSGATPFEEHDPPADADDGALALDRETSDTDTWEAFLQNTPIDDEADAPSYVIGEADEPSVAAQQPSSMDALEHPSREPRTDDRPPPEPTKRADLRTRQAIKSWDQPVSDEAEVPGTVLEWNTPPGLLQFRARRTRRAARWFLGSIILALVLAAQLVHYNRDALAADMRYGWFVRTGYARLGLPLYPSWPLEAYELRGAEAIAGRTAVGTLDVVAQIAVRGKQPVGLPMVRLVLRDRWSNTVGSRLLTPAEFLPEPQSRTRTYPPGAVVPVHISVADPGPAAQGYELDVCRPDRHRGLQCRSTGDPFRQ